MGNGVFLHVGAMKSATSYLQALCDHNKDRLAEAGVLYPGSRLVFRAVEDFMGPRKEVRRRGAWSTLIDKIHRFEGDVLVSNELLSQRDPRALRTMIGQLAPADVQVLITARDLIRTTPSQWQTFIRNGRTTPWAEFIEAVCEGKRSEVGDAFWKRQDVAAIVTRFARLVPVEGITVVTVPPPGSEPALTGRRFLSALGREIGPLVEPTYRNTSLGVHSAEFVRRLNLQTSDWTYDQYRTVFKTVLSSRGLENRSRLEPKLTLTARQSQILLERAKRMVGELEASGVRVIGDLDDLLGTPTTIEDAPDPGESSADELLAVAQDAVLALAMRLGTSPRAQAPRRHRSR